MAYLYSALPYIHVHYKSTVHCPSSARCLTVGKRIKWAGDLVRHDGASGLGPTVGCPMIRRVKPEALITQEFRPSEQPDTVVRTGYFKKLKPVRIIFRVPIRTAQ